MLTAEIKVNGRLVSVVTIQNVGGDSGPELKGVADYEVSLLPREEWSMSLRGQEFALSGPFGFVEDWDRSRPAHELVHAAIEAIMEASK